MSNTVYTYYEELPNMSGQLEILELWAQSWQRRGWAPTLLSDGHARCHPAYEQKTAEWATLPTVNSIQYELACYKRWLALQAVGGGLMVDYDVYNNGFLPDNSACYQPDPVVVLGESAVPCGVWATVEGCSRILSWFRQDPSAFIDYQGKVHVSDMFFFRRHAAELKEIPLCLSLRVVKWEEEEPPLIHFSYYDVQQGQLADGYKASGKADAFRHMLGLAGNQQSQRS